MCSTLNPKPKISIFVQKVFTELKITEYLNRYKNQKLTYKKP